MQGNEGPERAYIYDGTNQYVIASLYKTPEWGESRTSDQARIIVEDELGMKTGDALVAVPCDHTWLVVKAEDQKVSVSKGEMDKINAHVECVETKALVWAGWSRDEFRNTLIMTSWIKER